MKIGLAQLNTTVGDLEGNRRLILEAYRDLVARGAELVVTPELALTGYPPRDLLLRRRFDEDSAASLAAIAAEIGPALDAFRADPRLAGTKLVLELGRYLVGPAGWFLTRVVSVKQSRGARIAICDGGLNANLAASGNFGMVLRRNYVMHRVGGDDNGTRAEEKHDISGPLCTSIDKLGGGVMLPRLDEGDLIAIHACGAYGPTASPLYFISHPLPREVLLTGGQLQDATRITAR